eukprot:scaffold6120_cov109-Isochrysis_galbana.AAC.1
MTYSAPRCSTSNARDHSPVTSHRRSTRPAACAGTDVSRGGTPPTSPGGGAARGEAGHEPFAAGDAEQPPSASAAPEGSDGRPHPGMRGEAAPGVAGADAASRVGVPWTDRLRRGGVAGPASAACCACCACAHGTSI